MAGFIEQLISEHGDVVGSQLSQQLGISPDMASGLLPQLAPMILGGLQRQAEQKGPARVDHILDKHADDSILNDLSGFIGGRAQESNPDPGLGGLLGDSGFQASDMLSGQLGIGKDVAAKIIPMLAPIVLGALLKQRNHAGGSGSGTNAIMGMLDADGDGSILDDVAGMLMRGQGGSGGMLGKVLGGLFGGGR